MELLRFMLIGGLDTLFGLGVFEFLIFLKIHYARAALRRPVLFFK
jgi:hypothetical protein